MSWPAVLSPRILLALAIGTLAGLAANWAGLPLPWMLGPMLSLTIVSLAGVPVAGPIKFRPYVIPVLGVMLGSSLTPDIVSAIPRWAMTMALLVPFLAVAAAVSYTVYRRIGGYDPVTAYYSAMPGGLNEMILLGQAAGGDDRRISLAHALRILVVILFVSLFFGLVLGVSASGGRTWVPLSEPTLLDWVILVGAGLLGVQLGRLLRLPAPQLTGPLLLSGIAHATGLVQVPPPSLLIIIAQVVIGSILGCRFYGMPVRPLARDMGLAVLASGSMILVAVGFAWIVNVLIGMPIEQAFLAYSPGGLTEMSLLALALHQDVAYVAVTHVVRIIMVITAAGAVFRWLK